MVNTSNKDSLYQKKGHISVLRDFDSNEGKYPTRSILSSLGYSEAQLELLKDILWENTVDDN